MNLLPRVKQEFALTQYWDSFFKKRGKKTFEWYGDYLELCDQLHKYIKSKDKILVVGCGNSKLSMDLYDAGFTDITNIDVSNVVIKQMTDLNKNLRSNMKFLQMDATQMNFSDEEFSVILDKGTLDALMPDNSEDTIATITKYFKEIQRVLRNGGRYICISLLQEHILNFILEFFPNNNFFLRIIRCFANENQNDGPSTAANMPVFIIVATRFKMLPQPILEISLDGEKIQRVKSCNEILDAVVSIQKAAMVCNGLSRGNIAGHDEVQIELFRPNEDTARYTVFVIDQVPSSKNGTYAAFLVPQGREVEWFFSTQDGRKKLTESVHCNRLAIVIMNGNHYFNSWEDVKNELAECIRNLAPVGLKEQIPYLSLGTDVGERHVIANGFSEISGRWTVEDVKIDDDWYRRLIFQSSQFVVQSESRLKIANGKEKLIDMGYLACEHHRFIVVGVNYAINKYSNNKGGILVVGLGGGALCTFIHELFRNQKITAIEIDETILEAAKKYFGLKEDEKLNVVIADGIDYLTNKATERKQFNTIIFDIDSKDLSLGVSCPPKCFLESNTLNVVKTLLKDEGLFILNLVCRDNNLKDKIVDDLKIHFKTVFSYKLEADLNEIIYCQNNQIKNIENLKLDLKNSAQNINQKLKKLKLSKNDMINVTDFIKKLEL